MIGKGTRRELALARRAIKVARSHLAQARCGLTGDADGEVTFLLEHFHHALQTLTRVVALATAKPKRTREAA